jgi:hypothetical protein
MKQRASSAAVVYMPCIRTGISASAPVPASCKSERWIPRFNVLGMVCASGGGPAAHAKWERRKTLGLRKGKDEWKKGRRGALRHIAREAMCSSWNFTRSGYSPVCQSQCASQERTGPTIGIRSYGTATLHERGLCGRP